METRSSSTTGAGTDRRRAVRGATLDERFEALFDDLRKPARVMVRRAFGSAISDEEAEDIYASAWASTLSALRGRAERMDDEELRAYLLTAVANHASKEMRRRSRRPTRPLEDTHAQVLADTHQPLPEEQVSGAESGSIARDVLASLPKRRRAVMLLRYGWGLAPTEICALVANLSPRAYRKEITRGVGEMIERLGQVESGDWCRSREPLLREYVAGTAAEEARRQATAHLGHCRQCSELVARLQGHLHDLGSSVAWTSVAGTVGEQKFAVGERIAAGLERSRDVVTRSFERSEAGASEAAGTISTAGGSRGAGVAGVGALAKVAGLGTAGKAAIACLGAGAAATACVAAGVVPGVGQADRGKRETVEKVRSAQSHVPLSPPGSVDAVIAPGKPKPAGEQPAENGAHKKPEGADSPEQTTVTTAPEGAPAASPAPTAPPVEQEFGATAAATTSSGSGGSGGAGGGSGGSARDIDREFGP